MKRKITFALLLFVLSTFHSFADINPDEELNKCATFLSKQEKIKILNKFNNLDVFYFRPNLQCHYPSKSGKFLVHYDTLGGNAVSKIDLNHNKIPDYIDSVAYYADYVYSKECDEFGFKISLSDSAKGGDDKYDIYVVELGIGKKGMTVYGLTDNDVEIKPKIGFERYTSTISIDNDYSPDDYTILDDGTKVKTYKETGFIGLKITLAHEFHHAIQFYYGHPFPKADCLAEAVSVFFENKLFPESRDFTQYVNRLLLNPASYPFGDGEAINGYRYGVFFHYIDSKYGVKPILRWWELVGIGLSGYKALDSALKEVNSSLKDTWNGFIPQLYFTGTFTSGTNTILYADELKNLSFTNFKFTTNPFEDKLVDLLPYQLKTMRIINSVDNLYNSPDTIDVILTNANDYKAQAQFLEFDRFNYKLINYVENEFTQIVNSNWHYQYNTNLTYAFPLSFHFLREGTSGKQIAHCYPNPFIKSKDKKIFFPAPDGVELNKKIELTLYTIDYMKIIEETLPVQLKNDTRILEWEPNTNYLNSGTYIFEIKYGDDFKLGKIAIIND